MANLEREVSLPRSANWTSLVDLLCLWGNRSHLSLRQIYGSCLGLFFCQRESNLYIVTLKLPHSRFDPISQSLEAITDISWSRNPRQALAPTGSTSRVPISPPSLEETCKCWGCAPPGIPKDTTRTTAARSLFRISLKWAPSLRALPTFSVLESRNEIARNLLSKKSWLRKRRLGGSSTSTKISNFPRLGAVRRITRSCSKSDWRPGRDIVCHANRTQLEGNRCSHRFCKWHPA